MGFRRYLSLFTVALSFGIVSTQASDSWSERPWAMAILGDSIAAGSLSDFPIPQGSTPEESVSLWRDQALEPQFIYTNKRRLSWGSGTEIASHYLLLKKWLRSRGVFDSLNVVNVSKPGRRMEDLEEQVERLLEALQRKAYRGLKYVAMTIGSNDACGFQEPDRVPKTTLRKDLERAFLRLSRGIRALYGQKGRVPVLVIGVPQIPNLGDPQVLRTKTLFGLSCSVVRDKILKYCNPLTEWEDHSDYLQRLRVVTQVNSVLESMTRNLDPELQNLDLFYSNRLFEMNIPIHALAADCFHPGKIGQQEISFQTWEDQPWFH